MLDAYPEAEYKPYTCTKCGLACSSIVNSKFCLKCFVADKDDKIDF